MNSTQVKDSTPVVKKTIPKKTMGYLKFAYWALHQPGDNIQKLFLDRSIDEIIHHVSQIVDHGDQHITINTLHKNLRDLINPKKSKTKAEPKAKPEPKSKAESKSKAEPKSKAESKSKPASKSKPTLDLPDTIVTQLVTLARQDFDTTPTPTPTPTPKKPRAKKIITPEIPETLLEPIVGPLIETPVEPIVEPIIETILETPIETFAEPISETLKKPRPTPTKKIKVKQYATFEPVSPTLQLSHELFP